MHSVNRYLSGRVPSRVPGPACVEHGVRRGLWSRRGQNASPSTGSSRMPTSTQHAPSRPLQEYRHASPYASLPRSRVLAGPSTPLATASAPWLADPYAQSLLSPSSSSHRLSASIDLHANHRQPVSARPAGLNARVSCPTASRAPPSIHRPSLQPGTANSVPNTSSAAHAERLQLEMESTSSSQFARRPTMPSLPPVSQGKSNFTPEAQRNALDLLDAALPDNAAGEIRNLFQNMPEIEMAPEDRAITPVQMSCKLMEHQKIALMWLKDQENNRHKRGGLLAGMLP